MNLGNKSSLKNVKTSAAAGEWMRLAVGSGFKATQLAKLAGVSARTLQRHFKAHYGMTASDWLKEVRLREASQRIQAGDRVKEVAMDLGYKQLSHFSREFKRAYGQPPTRIPTISKVQDTATN